MRRKEGVRTSLGIEEHEGLVEGERVVVGRGAGRVVARHRLDDEGDETGEEAASDDGADGPEEELAADDNASEIDILLLLLPLVARPRQEPALLRLVQLPRGGRQRRPVQVHVPAPLVVRRRIRMDLQRTPPRIPLVHAHLPSPDPDSPLAPTLFSPLSPAVHGGNERAIGEIGAQRDPEEQAMGLLGGGDALSAAACNPVECLPLLYLRQHLPAHS